jgi:hypothetical protein
VLERGAPYRPFRVGEHPLVGVQGLFHC